MHANELLDKIGREPLPPVLLLTSGKAPFQKEPWEPHLAERAVERIISTLVDPSMRDMALGVFHADETKVADIVLEAQTLPFLVERRVIVVRNADKYNTMSGEKNSALYPLIGYLENPSESTVLVLIASIATNYAVAFLPLNLMAWAVLCLFPKLPMMHGVRMFGINSTPGIDR